MPTLEITLATPLSRSRPSWLFACRSVAAAGVLGLVVAIFPPVTTAHANTATPSGTWTKTPDLSHERQRHTATRLADGSVLVAGGGGQTPYAAGHGSVSATERFNPTTGEWSLSGSMGTARSDHTATALPDGRVLVTGGNTPLGVFGYASPLDSAELYDPDTGTWTEAAPMSVPRAQHIAVLLEGPECGEQTSPEWCGRVLVTGGAPSSVPTGSDQAELYDPATGTWSSCLQVLADATCPGPTNHQRRAATATLLTDGGVLLAGGVIDMLTVPPSTERYEPATGTWSSCAASDAHTGCPGPLVRNRLEHAATRLADHRVLVVGGRAQSGSQDVADSAEVYEPATGRWAETARMSAERREHTATLLADGSVLVAGGALGARGAEAERYLSPSDTWQATPPMHHPRGTHTATLLDDGRVLVVGGGHGAALRSAEIFQLDQDPETCWTPPRGSVNPPAPPPSPPPVLCPTT